MRIQSYQFVIGVICFLYIPFTALGFKDGLGLYGGFSTINLNNPVSGFESDFTGIDFGIDYQIKLNEEISINPFAVSSSGDGDTMESGGFLLDTELSVLSIGAQLRYWLNEFFLGGHIANYSAKATVTEVTSGISASDTESGTGFGGALGVEKESGLLFFIRLDFVTVGNADLTGIMGNVGWRF